MSPLPPAGHRPPASAPPAARASATPAIRQAAEHLAAGRPSEAADALARIAADTPTYAAAHVLHAVALEAAGQPAAALAAWHRAAFLVPQSPLVLRERQRLVALTPAPPEAVQPEALPSEAARPDSLGGATSPDETTPDETADEADLPALETLPLGDLAPSLTGDAAMETDDGDFDPDGFDFSAFDTDDETPDWLGAPLPDAAPAAPGLPAFGEDPAASAWLDDDPAPPITDWADSLADDAVRLMPPESAPGVPPPAARAGAPSAWAVFEDEPSSPDTPPDVAPPDVALPAVPPDVTDEVPPPAVADELDSLIASLEQAPRIRPDPTFSGPAVGTAGTAADVAEMASETLARIYAAQHQYVRAALVYETLAAREPERAEAMLAQAAAMRQRRAG